MQLNPYQVGGSLRQDDPSYVFRAADGELLAALQQGEFCYVLNARQMGKSSLRVQVKHQLEQRGVRCAVIDLTRLGSGRLTLVQWYRGLIVELWRSLNLADTVKVMVWLRERADLPPVQQLGQFLDEVVLTAISAPIVILVDEIDTVLGLEFSSADFFALIRSCYEQRSERSAYTRLTFALFGVASPADLIRDHHRTPFNIGRSIALHGFQFSEVRPLIAGLEGVLSEPAQALREILRWTGGQPFLTQKLCRLLLDPSASSLAIRSATSTSVQPMPFLQELVQEALAAHSEISVRVETLVRSRLIANWEVQDYPEHFQTIARYLASPSERTALRLQRYLELLVDHRLPIDHSPEQAELLLAGIVVRREHHLEMQNPIYAKIFNAAWVQRRLQSLGLPPAVVTEPPSSWRRDNWIANARGSNPPLPNAPGSDGGQSNHQPPITPVVLTPDSADTVTPNHSQHLVSLIQSLSPAEQHALAIAIAQQLPTLATQIQAANPPG